MSKKQSTLGVFNETTDAPANQDFVFDGTRGSLVLNIFDLQGTTPQITVTATELFEKGFSLAYDAQSANFTVGRTVVGAKSRAQGLIADDTDGGATGTLELKKVIGNFIDNEIISEEGQTTPGSALSNGVATRVLQEGAVWATMTGVAVDSNVAFLNPELVVTDGDRGVVHPRRFRLKITEVNTWTVAKFAVDLVQTGL